MQDNDAGSDASAGRVIPQRPTVCRIHPLVPEPAATFAATAEKGVTDEGGG